MAEPVILLTARELGARWGLSARTILARARDGSIPCVIISPRAIRFRLSDVETYENTHTIGAVVPEVER